MKKRLVHVVVSAAMTTLASGSAAVATDLTQEETIAFVKGKVLTTIDPGGSVGLDFRANGTVYGTSSRQSDVGTWSVKDGLLRMEWRRFEYTGCGAMRRIDGNRIQHLWPDGRLHVTLPAD